MTLVSHDPLCVPGTHISTRLDGADARIVASFPHERCVDARATRLARLALRTTACRFIVLMRFRGCRRAQARARGARWMLTLGGAISTTARDATARTVD